MNMNHCDNSFLSARELDLGHELYHQEAELFGFSALFTMPPETYVNFK